jgi:hypothetical protein
MGASEWMYFTAYEPDPEAALQRLRQAEFAAGRYGPQTRVGMAIQWLRRAGRTARTIEEALEAAAEDGTHSILDIQRTSRIEEFAAAVPLPIEKVRDAYGTTEPSKTLVQQQSALLLDRIPRWNAVYFPVYADGRPTEWAFLGCSGD